MDDGVRIREARPDEMRAAAAHYLGMRRELGWPDGQLLPDWERRFAGMHERGMAAGEMRYFVAVRGGEAIGSALAVIRRSPSAAFQRSRPRGHIANVFVEPAWRRRGIARALTIAAIDWLRETGCVSARLYASQAGRLLYESLGFAPGSEMRLRLADDAGDFE